MKDTDVNRSANTGLFVDLIVAPSLELIELPDETIEEKKLKLALSLRTY